MRFLGDFFNLFIIFLSVENIFVLKFSMTLFQKEGGKLKAGPLDLDSV